MKKNILIGIGNIGKSDDALGWKFLDNIQAELSESCDFEYRYQLQVEDAELIAHYDTAVFIDADMLHHPKGYSWNKVKPVVAGNFTSHELLPENVLYLCQYIYDKQPEAYLLSISGKNFALRQKITGYAQDNLKKAHDFFSRCIIKKLSGQAVNNEN